MIKKPAPQDDYMDIDQSEATKQPLIIEKVTEALRTCHTVQLATTLNFKPTAMSLVQMRETVNIGRDFANRAAMSY